MPRASLGCVGCPAGVKLAGSPAEQWQQAEKLYGAGQTRTFCAFASCTVTQEAAEGFLGDDAGAILQVLDVHDHFGMAHFFRGQAFAALERWDDAIEAFSVADEFTGSSLEVRAETALRQSSPAMAE